MTIRRYPRTDEDVMAWAEDFETAVDIDDLVESVLQRAFVDLARKSFARMSDMGKAGDETVRTVAKKLMELIEPPLKGAVIVAVSEWMRDAFESNAIIRPSARVGRIYLEIDEEATALPFLKGFTLSSVLTRDELGDTKAHAWAETLRRIADNLEPERLSRVWACCRCGARSVMKRKTIPPSLCPSCRKATTWRKP